jgi:hypothetical protein
MGNMSLQAWTDSIHMESSPAHAWTASIRMVEDVFQG